MGIAPETARASAALQGSSKSCPRPVAGETVAKVVQATAAALQGGTNAFIVTTDALGRERIKIGTTGGSIGSYLTFWTASVIGGNNGTYDGLRHRF